MKIRTRESKEKIIKKLEKKLEFFDCKKKVAKIRNSAKEKFSKRAESDAETQNESNRQIENPLTTERRYTWIDKNGNLASRKLTDYECRLENDVQNLQDALFSISSHYAKIQFRLRQIASSTGSERLCLLRDLEKVTCQGIDTTSQGNDELPNLLQDSKSFGNVRLRQKAIINQLRGRLSNLLEANDVCFPPEGECSYRHRKYQCRRCWQPQSSSAVHDRDCSCICCQEQRKANDISTLRKGYLCEVWPDQENVPKQVENDDENGSVARDKEKRKTRSKSKKKRHGKHSKKHRNSSIQSSYLYLNSSLGNSITTPSVRSHSSRKSRSASRRSSKRQKKVKRSYSRTSSYSSHEIDSNVNSRVSSSIYYDDQEGAINDSQEYGQYEYPRNICRCSQDPSASMLEMSPSFIEWYCSKPHCLDECKGKCSITGNCFEFQLADEDEGNRKKKSKKNKSKQNMKSDKEADMNDSKPLRRKIRNSAIWSMKKAVSSYFQGARSSSTPNAIGSTLVYPHAIGRPSNLCKSSSRASFRHSSSRTLNRSSSCDLSEHHPPDSTQHYDEFQP